MELGHGGMATLHLARLRGPETFEKLLALKVVHTHLAQDPTFQKMFLDEARIAALIHHPNVATTFDMGDAGGTHFIAMEYVHGESLTGLLRQAARTDYWIPWPFAVRIVADAAAGLHAAHELCSRSGEPLNVVHRDVSPQNILISYDGHVKVVDFGVAWATEKLVHTETGAIKGKISYLSPEQLEGVPPDRRSDIFSLGIVLFETVCQQRLFTADTDLAALFKVREARIPRPTSIRPDLPAELERFILRALDRDPGKRFQTAQEMVSYLEQLLVSHQEAISDERLSRLMEDLFAGRREKKDRLLRAVLDGEVTTRRPAAPSEESGTQSIGPAEVVSVGGVDRRRPALVAAGLAGALIAVALAVGAGYLFGGRPPARTPHQSVPTTAPPAPDATATGARPAPARPMDLAPHLVYLSVTVWPQTADVTLSFRGMKHRTTAFKAVLPRSHETVFLDVTAPGFVSQRVAIVPVTDSDLTISLVSLAGLAPHGPDAAVSARPRPRIRRRRVRRPRPRPRRAGGSPLRDLID